MSAAGYEGRKAIKTKYKEVWFKSRLEAHWAEYFDAQETEWKYEPEQVQIDSFRFYTYDFYIRVKGEDDTSYGVLCEVKPTWDQATDDTRLTRLSEISGNVCVYLIGEPPLRGVVRDRWGVLRTEAVHIHEGEWLNMWDPSRGTLQDWLLELHVRWGYG